VKNEGFWLSLEAIAGLAILAVLLSIPLHSEGPGLERLQAVKKQHDLLALWVSEPEKSLEKMRQDFEMAFPGKQGLVFLDRKSLEAGFQGPASLEGRQAVSSKAVFFDSAMARHEIRLVLFQD
jgi:hypothetical protein